MSRIQSLQNYNYASYRQNNYNKNRKPLAFKGAAPEVTRLTKDEANAVDKVLDFFTGKIKGPIMDYASETVGEIQNLLIMNIGTAFVAPIFIVNNPLSHENSKSKKYTAWRQPISAVIALTMGLTINKYAPLYVEKYLEKGKIPSLDLSLSPTSSSSQAAYKSLKKLKNFDALFEDSAKQSKKIKEYKKVLDLANLSLKSIAEQDNVEFTEIKTKEDFLREFSNKKVFSDAVSDGAATKYAEKLLDPDNPKGLHHITVRDFFVDRLGFKKDYADPEKLNKYATKDHLEELHASDMVNELGFNYTKRDLHSFIGHTLDRSKSNLPDPDRVLVNRLVESAFSADVNPSSKLLLMSTNQRDNLAGNKELLGGNMYDFLCDFNKKLDVKDAIAKEEKDGVLVLSHRAEQIKAPTIKQLAKGIAKKMAKEVSANYGGYAKGQGIILTLLTLPLSCGVLNWAYPRVMNKCFPKLAQAKADSAAAEEKKGGKV